MWGRRLISESVGRKGGKPIKSTWMATGHRLLTARHIMQPLALVDLYARNPTMCANLARGQY